MCAVAGSWARRRPSLAPYVTGTGATKGGRPLLEGANVDSPLNLALLDRREDYDQIRAIWLHLQSLSNVSYFLSWSWVEHWLASLPDNLHVKLAVMSQHDRPILAFFLGQSVLVRHRILKSRGLFLNATGRDEYDSLCIEYNAMLNDGSSPSSLVEILKSLPADWEEFLMPGLDAGAFPGNLLATPPDGYRLEVDKNVPSPYVDLEAVRRAKDGYLSLLSSNTRAQIRRTYRGYAAAGPITTEIANDLDHALAIYRELVDLHQKSWQERGEPGAFGSAWFEKFHRELIRKRFEHGEVQLVRVSCGAQTVGCLYNFVFRGKVYFYQGGIRYQDDARLKPGLIAHVEAVQRNAALGHDVYDFLGGASRYKSSLATHHRRLIWVRVQKPQAKFWIEHRLRAVKRSLQRAI